MNLPTIAQALRRAKREQELWSKVKQALSAATEPLKFEEELS
jgi:hypothetical protein